jgi:hypothetical protein
MTPPRIDPLRRALQVCAAVIGTLCCVVAATAADSSLALRIGDRVQTSAQTPIWLSPPFAGKFGGNQPAQSSGSVVDGPVRAAEVWWWKIRFDTGSEGWVAERQLRNSSGQTAAPAVNDVSLQSTSTAAGSFLKLNIANGSTVNSPRLMLEGNVASDVYSSPLVSFSVNGTSIALDRHGEFSLPLNLRIGSNTIRFETTTPNPRQQPNLITAFIDGSVIYGSDSTRSTAIRSFQGGKLATSAGNLPPLNTVGLANANDAHLFPDGELFLAGDVRANENVELTAIHTLFLREHNQIAAAIGAANQSLTDEQIFQMTRRIVAAEL